MVEIRVYGKLRKYLADKKDSQDSFIHITPSADETVASILDQLGIPVGDVYSIFLNSRLLAARSGMAKWIGYQQTRTNIFDWDLREEVKSGDRLGLFGRDMASLVV